MGSGLGRDAVAVWVEGHVGGDGVLDAVEVGAGVGVVVGEGLGLRGVAVWVEGHVGGDGVLDAVEVGAVGVVWLGRGLAWMSCRVGRGSCGRGRCPGCRRGWGRRRRVRRAASSMTWEPSAPICIPADCASAGADRTVAANAATSVAKRRRVMVVNLCRSSHFAV